jgi:hypothetical protein
MNTKTTTDDLAPSFKTNPSGGLRFVRCSACRYGYWVSIWDGLKTHRACPYCSHDEPIR